MIPYAHVLVLALLQFSLGLAGMLLRRSGIVVLVSALVMLNGILLILSVGAGSTFSVFKDHQTICQSAGLVVLAVMIALAAVGICILYTFNRFHKTVDLDEQDRMRH